MSDLVVETSCGKVRGLRKDGVAQWRAIPFAAPPTGPLRFLPPRPPIPWAGERDATRFGPVAQQSRDPATSLMSGVFPKTVMSEDCLALNIYSPSADAARRPVAVWIHGGAFIMGSGSQSLYNGTSFAARHDLVVVTINYRLGLFGLLYLGELAGDAYRYGNVALHDQLAALRWVRENIAAFGGDPSRVTVMGESAGAMSIGNLLGMPAAAGLFDRAILQSGAPALIPPDRADATAAARGVLAELAIDPSGLAGVPAERLVAIQEQLVRARGLGAFNVYVDGASIPRHPTDAVRDGAAPKVPLLIGANRDEWALFDVFLGEASTAALKAQLVARLGDDILRIHAAYRDTRSTARSPDAAAWLDVIGDLVFRVPARRLADAHSRHAPVWTYRFDWETPAFNGRLGAAHALELPFVWNQLDQPAAQLLLGNDLTTGRQLAAQMHEAWATFIRDGAPAAAGLPPWPRYDEARRATMLLDREPRLAADPDGALHSLWSAV